MTQLPERYKNSVVPHIMIKGANNAIEFYKKAFNAHEVFRIAPDQGPIIHAEIMIENSLIMLGDADGEFNDPKTLAGTTVGLHVYVENVDALFHQAIIAGGEAIQPVQDMFYGDRMGMLKDPFGHIWVLLTSKESLTPDEIMKRAEALFKK